MKYSKAAAAVAGTVAALAASGAAPALAAEGGMVPPMSLNGGVTDTLNAAAPVTANLPQHLGNGLAEQAAPVNQAVGVVQGVNKARNNAPGQLLESANLVGQVAPMLGGLKVNGGQG
ncbi:hypothetical protein DEJ50_13600 [Streptomyces venezuelae]|uniref:Secreted protein n=1 Tax=Streptomyces venezuelae TaxID=54571 RepID=A0A5P2D0S5_STRVZ|nr:hypothetical protein [Streptomyces venezuelae]QES48705.1 hypothetical protein DEJ50_13600 [Streptomyces venezuelae]